MSTAEVRILARSLVCALAEDFALTEVADVLTLAGQLARKAVEIRDRRDQPASSGDRRDP
jgi:hypothetical protein